MGSSLMEIKTAEELGPICWKDFVSSPTLEEFRYALGLCDAYWVYEGEPTTERPHALLTSGQHSNGFINLGAVLKEYEGFRGLLAISLLRMLQDRTQITGVVGSDSSATALAGDVANILKVRHIKMVKVEDESGKRQAWPEGQELLGERDLVLHIEELVTTSSSAQAVRRGIAEVHQFTVQYHPVLPLIVDRSSSDYRLDPIGWSIVRPLYRIPIQNFDPSECLYCKAGSKPVAPKANWEYLTRLR